MSILYLMDNLMLAQAYNNLWANHRLYKTLGTLSLEDFEAPRACYFGSIQKTAQHLLEVDRFYIDALEGGELGVWAWSLPLAEAPEELRLEQQAWDRRLVEVCRSPPETVTMDRGPRGVVTDRADRILMHLFQHQIHHRGQLHGLVSLAGGRPPQLDEFYCTNEAHLRADDLAELDLSEEEVWP